MPRQLYDTKYDDKNANTGGNKRMRINFQNFFMDLQKKIIDLYETDPTKAKTLKEIVDEVLKEQKPAVGWCEN